MNKRILVVDDSAEIQEMLHGVLTDEDYEVDMASNGVDALEYLTRTGGEIYSLILLDLRMPKMDGYRCFQEFQQRKIHPAIPVIIMSAELSASYDLLQKGANAFLRKPFDLHDLLSLVLSHTMNYEYPCVS